MEKLKALIEKEFTEEMLRATLSNGRTKQVAKKIVLRPFLEKGQLMFQIEEFRNNQVFHENIEKEEAVSKVCEYLRDSYKQLDLQCKDKLYTILVSKKGVSNIKCHASMAKQTVNLSHNREKQYVLDTNVVIPFLVDLGVQTPQGKIVDKMYKKFRQINRFLEFVRDIVSELPTERKVKIIDFGCGKSYLTFAVYYYLKIMNGIDVDMTGLDLKEDVIRHCNELAEKYRYTDLHFSQGNIGDYEGTDKVDMVITLHACDTATDLALNKAIRWGAKVILSVPCCQHEINKQIEPDLLQPVCKYGILKERMSAILTDGLRANLLEQQGYDVQILEFIDMEHTPKNLLIRAIKKKTAGNKNNAERYEKLCDTMNLHGTLEKLLKKP